MPLIITAKRTARIAEPNTKSSLCMLANATHELMFHDTIEEDSSSFEPCRAYRAASHQKQNHGSRGKLLTNALRDHRPQPVRQDLSIARSHEPCMFLARMRSAERPGCCLLIGEDRKSSAHGQSDAIDPRRKCLVSSRNARPPRASLFLGPERLASRNTAFLLLEAYRPAKQQRRQIDRQLHQSEV